MVCKRSLYCWKNGPCASDQARKQIWEDNIRFRENLRSMNQSDHYWSFQIANNGSYCSCIAGQYAAQRQPVHKKFLSGSLQKLDCIDCSSITHDLKTRQGSKRLSTDEIFCPEHIPPRPSAGDEFTKSILKSDPYAMKNSYSACDVNNNINSQTTRSRPMSILTPCIKQKPDEDYPKYCPRYKNTLTNVPLNSAVRFKYSSQPSLLSDKRRADVKKNNFEVKSSSPSMENLKDRAKIESDIQRNLTLLEKKNVRLPKRIALTKPAEKLPERKNDLVDQDLDDAQPAPVLKKSCPRNVYTPLSRTTRRSVLQQVKIPPFVTFGCNNASKDVGTKRTHNVLAAPLEVYPSAINAKEQRHSMIVKFLKTEKDFQRKLLPDNFKKKLINHSSVWAQEMESKLQDNASDFNNFNKTTNKVHPIINNKIQTQSLGQYEGRASTKPKKNFRRSNSQARFY